MANTMEENKSGQATATANAAPKKTGTSNRGFASMDPERQRQIASQGGKAAHASGNAHEFTSEEARIAGRKGGESRGRNSKSKSSGSSEERPGGMTGE